MRVAKFMSFCRRPLFLLGLLAASVVYAERIERLEAGGSVYENVSVRSVSASTITILHAKGLTQVNLRELSPRWQRHFGYDAVEDMAYQESLKARSLKRASQAEQSSTQRMPAAAPAPKASALQLFGAVPHIMKEVDMRPRFAELELGTRTQGRRPSCSVFAIIGALEYLQAEAKGEVEKLSEEYLIWATLKTLGRDSGIAERSEAMDFDAGFTLGEVAQAMRAYGVPLRSEVPYSMVGSLENEYEPSDEVIDKARSRSKIRSFSVPGRDARVRVSNIINAINQGSPVVAGMAWPSFKTLRHTALLSKQKPLDNYAHAVTIIGYRSSGSQLEDTTFIFRNSWGRHWGSGGYGFIRYEYLEQHLNDAIILEVDE